MKDKHQHDEELLTYQELAFELKLSVKTLQNWKSLGKFHPSEYVKFGNSKQADIRFKKAPIMKRIMKNSF